MAEFGSKIPKTEITRREVPLLKEFKGIKGLRPLDQVVICSSIKDPHDPQNVLGGEEILKRGPKFFLGLYGLTPEQVREKRGERTYMSGVPLILDPVKVNALSMDDSFRLVLPKVVSGEPQDLAYEVQLIRRPVSDENNGSQTPSPLPDTDTIPLIDAFKDYFDVTPITTEKDGKMRTFQIISRIK